MSNPFCGLINSDMINIHYQMIGEVIRATAVPCQLIYGTTKNNICPNCKYDGVAKRSTNIYNGTGPYPFSSGTVCPMCNGVGTNPVVNNDIIPMSILWNDKHWLNLGFNVDSPKGYVQTITYICHTQKIKNASYVIIDTNISGDALHKYQRYGEPKPAGFGQDVFIVTMWKEME